MCPDQPRALNSFIASASAQLQSVFGMEIVEYRAKQKTGPGETQAQAQKGKGRAREDGEDDASSKNKGWSVDISVMLPALIPQDHRLMACGPSCRKSSSR